MADSFGYFFHGFTRFYKFIRRPHRKAASLIHYAKVLFVLADLSSDHLPLNPPINGIIFFVGIASFGVHHPLRR